MKLEIKRKKERKKKRSKIKVMKIATKAGLRLRIVDYFGSLVNRVDLEAEKLLAWCAYSNLEAQEGLNINEKVNLAHVESLKINQLNDESSGFKEFCFLLFQDNYQMQRATNLDARLGHLVVLNKYVTKKQMNCFKELLKFEPSQTNKIFGLKHCVK